MFLKSLMTPRFKCGNDSETIEVRALVLSDWAKAIRYNNTEIVLEAEVPPWTILIRLDSLAIFLVAVV